MCETSAQPEQAMNSDILQHRNSIRVGDIVQHFKRETCADKSKYVYKVLAFATHTETEEELVVYQALYENPETGVRYGVYVRPADMFFSPVDRNKYPDIRQKYRFERI